MDYASLREGIYHHLVAQVGAVGGRVFWEWTAPADTTLPFIEIAFMGEIPSPNKCAMHQQLEVLVLGQQSDILSLDPVADAVVTALHHQALLTTSSPPCSTELCYVRDSRQDLWVEQFNAACIRLKFLIPTDFW